MKYLITILFLIFVVLIFCTENNKKRMFDTEIITIDLPVNFNIVDTSSNYAIFEHGLLQRKRLSITKDYLCTESQIIDSFINSMIDTMNTGYEFETSDMYFSEFWGADCSTKTLKIKTKICTHELSVLALKQLNTNYLVVVSTVFADHAEFFDSIAKLNVILK